LDRKVFDTLPPYRATTSSAEASLSFNEFMQRPAVKLRTGGRYSLASRHDPQGNRREFACRTTRISPFQMLVAAPVLGPQGERVISFFGELGKLDGWITDVVEGGFLVDLSVTRKAREGLATKLSWLEKKQRDAVIDSRKQHRLVPENPHTNLIFGDGTTRSCFVIDVSPSGAAISADVEPEIGTRLAVGRAVGHVVRRFNEGFAIQFDRVHEMDYLEQTIRPPEDLPTYLSRRPQDLPTYLSRPPTASFSPNANGASMSGLTGCAALLPEENIYLID
jgi:PilZ domain